MKHELSDLAAIHDLKRGDIRGLDLLVERYQVKAVRAAYLITQDRQLAEDVMQSAFIRAYDRIHQFDEGRPFAPWFMRIVVNMALKSVNARQKLDFSESLDDLFSDQSPNPAEVIEAQEMEATVREAIARLTLEQRAVIVLRYYLGYNEREISDKLARPIGTVRWRIHAAHKQLRRLLMNPPAKPVGGDEE